MVSSGLMVVIYMFWVVTYVDQLSLNGSFLDFWHSLSQLYIYPDDILCLNIQILWSYSSTGTRV